MDRHFEYLFKSAAADQKFVETRVWRCDVCDDQRSSLMIQLQSVSESLFTLIICTDLTLIDNDLSNAIVIKIPLDSLLLVYFNISE